MRQRIQYIGAVLALSGMVFLMPQSAKAAEASHESSCEVSIPVQTELTGTVDQTKDMLEFTVSLRGENVPLPAVSSLQIRGTGSGVFGPIIYTQPGDYEYQVYQQTENKEDLVYDKNVYDVTVRIVWDANDELAAEVWTSREGEDQKQGQILFSNQWINDETPAKEETPTPMPTPTVKKTVKSIIKTGDSQQIEKYLLLALAAAGVFGAGTWNVRRKMK